MARGAGTMKHISEVDIKAAFLQHLREEKVLSKGDILTSEYVLGSNGRRADLAFWATNFVGVEIKSEADTLGRLRDQVAVYEHCFERTVVVVAPKHVSGCLQLLSEHIGLWVVDRSGYARCIRAALPNSGRLVSPQLELLTLAELRQLAGADKSHKSRKALISICSQLPNQAITGAVKTSFVSRFEQVSEEFWASLGRKKVGCANVEMLTRFAKKNARLKEVKEVKEAFWENWRAEAARSFSSQPIY